MSTAEHLMRNLAALSARQSIPSARLTATPIQTRVEAATGGPVLLLERSNRWVALNSRRDPVAEAGRWLDEAMPQANASTVIVIGAGLGYVLDALDRRSPDARVVAIEPTAECARALLDNRDWSARVKAGRLRLLVGPDYSGVEDLFWMLEGSTAPPVVAHPVMVHELPEAMAEARRAAARAVYAAQANRTARQANAGRYLTNTLRNAAAIAAEADVDRLTGLFPELPAVVISAGPSLDATLDELRALQQRAILIAVDTALRPLLTAGITPHLVVGLDPSRSNAEHLLDLGDPSSVYLVAEGSLHPAAFTPFRGRTFVFRVSDHHPWPWLASLECDRGILKVRGSVATAAFDLARRLACEPIVFVGQDLAYTGGRAYCAGTTWERTGTPPGKRAEIAAVDIHGQRTTTAEHLVAFRDWLVEQSHGDRRRYVNASDGGILEGGRIEVLPLREALAAATALDHVVVRARLRAAHVAGNAARVQHAIEQLRSGAPAEPLASWRDFAGPTITDGTILRALGARPVTEPITPAAVPPSEPRNTRSVLSAADRARLEYLTEGRSSNQAQVPVLYVGPDIGASDSDLVALLDEALSPIPPGGMLVIADLSDRVVGTRVRQAIQSCLSHRHDLAYGRLTSADWLSRVTMVVCEPRGRAALFARTHAETTTLAELVVRRLSPSSVVAIGPTANTWIEPFSHYPDVSTAHYPDVSTARGRASYDVVLGMDVLVHADASDHQRLIDDMAELGDTIVLEIPTPGFEGEPQRSYRPMAYWAELLLSRGFVLADELRPAIEDCGIFPKSYDFCLLHVARRIQSPEARAAIAGSGELRALLTASASRIDDLFMQALALRLDRLTSRGRPLPCGARVDIALDADEFEHAGGHCYALRFVEPRLRATQRSGLLVDAAIHEDGMALPMAQSMASDIQAHGGGRYWVRADAVYFSASDNTDPRTNGRRYALRMSADAAILAGVAA